MAEMIIPGTYIDVRAEGLISAGRIATGVVGIVGTAQNGPINTPITLAGLVDAQEIFGGADPWNDPIDGSNPLTLVRSLEQLYANGASSVIAVRVAAATHSTANFAVLDGDANPVAILAAAMPGSWGNDIAINVSASANNCLIEGEQQTSGFSALSYTRIIPSAQNRIQVRRGVTKLNQTFDIVYKKIIENEEVPPDGSNRFFVAETPVEAVPAVNGVRVLDASDAVIRTYGDGDILYGAGVPGLDEISVNPATGEIIFEATQVPATGETVIADYAVGHAAPISGQVLVTVWNGSLVFFAGEAPVAANGDVLTANYLIDKRDCVTVQLAYGAVSEAYNVPDGRILAARVNALSRLAVATADAGNGGHTPATGISAYFGTGANVPGSNGAEAGPDEYSTGLDAIADKLVNIVVVAGQDAATLGSTLVGHLNATAETDHERIGVIGASGDKLADFLGHSMASDRLILVAPGMLSAAKDSLTSAYTAAAVAGLISSVSVQTSLTNKALNIPGLTLEFNRGEQEQLIKRNVLAVVNKVGFRIVKGLTTEGEGAPFSAVPTRRIVDYAKYGVRSGANPYIGRLNNERVRAALKATIDAFLTRMVQDEALTGYDLEVTATRAQEIAGEVRIVMTLQPTFSIEFIRVTMNLK
jgi:hypothetical protein